MIELIKKMGFIQPHNEDQHKLLQDLAFPQTRRLTYVVSVVYLLVSISHFFVLTNTAEKLILVPLGLFSCLAIFATARYLPRYLNPATSAMHLVVVLLMLLNTLMHMYLSESLWQSSTLMLVVVALGGFMVERRLLLLSLFSGLVIWASMVMHMHQETKIVVHFAFGLGMSVMVSLLLFSHRVGVFSQLVEQRKQLQYIADVDQLSLCLRRHAFDVRAEKLLSNSEKQAFSVLYCDLDYFKLLNDSMGHSVGDQALQRYGKLLLDLAKPHKLVVGRMGGEEFVLAGCIREDQAALLAEQIVHNLEELMIAHPESLSSMYLTCSIGVASSTIDHNFSSLCKYADRALYIAKHSGRNQHQVHNHYQLPEGMKMPVEA
ncbi:GGDEF domain-containing protein [Agarivorans sp. 1_MG-2023]|uniref:GGDEF domain-containing protein n=1 Tax=Agarivorans sp. 1_MG-2023 TaxID=3062634 RepID=UPI0026E17A99|nr:GGDEF domain-containing protein [Agarivorans sp. 1_MG-2023]MDO6763361.1 GGDEF domain-containing protein [Agarivorans sp. 1_MG-2023]